MNKLPLIFLVAMWGQSTAPSVSKQAPDTMPMPTHNISDKLQTQFYKFEADYLGAQRTMEATPEWKDFDSAKNRLTGVIELIQQECGKEYKVQVTKNNKVECVIVK